MNPSCNYVVADAPNIPLVAEQECPDLPFGEFVPYTPEGLESVIPGTSRDMFLPNFTLRVFEGRVERDAIFYNQQGRGLDMLGSCFFLKGRIKSFLPGTPNSIVSRDYSHNFKFDPGNEFRHLCKADTDLNFIHISYMPDFLRQFLPEDEPWAEKLKARIERKERIVGDHFAAIEPAQEQALKNIFNTPLKGKLGYMMIETSIIQLVLLQMYSLFHRKEAYKDRAVSKRDLEIIHDLKVHLHKRFLEDHTLSGLAQQFGTNTNKLMSLFRKVFGKSIFEFIADQRMDHARNLLREEGMLVAEVSRNIGYKNPNHFSAAFKKRFGVNPSALRC